MTEPGYRQSVLEAVVETVPDGILVVDDDRQFFTYNQQFVEMWDIPSEVVESGDDQRALESVLDELERPDEFLQTVEYFYEHREEVGQDVIDLADGRIFDRYTAPATGDDGTYYGRIWVFEDITERRRQRQQLQRQNERLEELIGVISHDLRSPLNVAQARLDMARSDCESEHLDIVDRSHERMEALIDDLLTLAREGRTAVDTTEVDLAAVAEACWETVETKRATLVTDTTQKIRADESRLRGLFENLVRNAVEHGGEDVTVTVGELEDGFYVEDDGEGILPDNRERVFDTEYSTSDVGTGFGLGIVRQIAEAHEWEVSVTEGQDGGARFEITGVSTGV